MAGTTRTELDAVVRALADATGRAYHVDPWVGGWNMNEKNADGSETHILHGRTKRELADLVRAMLAGHRLATGERP